MPLPVSEGSSPLSNTKINNLSPPTAVIRGLIAMNKEFIRIHEDEVFEINMIKKSIVSTSHRNQFYQDEVSTVWYRRGANEMPLEEVDKMIQ